MARSSGQLWSPAASSEPSLQWIYEPSAWYEPFFPYENKSNVITFPESTCWHHAPPPHRLSHVWSPPSVTLEWVTSRLRSHPNVTSWDMFMLVFICFGAPWRDNPSSALISPRGPCPGVPPGGGGGSTRPQPEQTSPPLKPRPWARSTGPSSPSGDRLSKWRQGSGRPWGCSSTPPTPLHTHIYTHTTPPRTPHTQTTHDPRPSWSSVMVGGRPALAVLWWT